jgi:alpha-galactosidase
MKGKEAMHLPKRRVAVLAVSIAAFAALAAGVGPAASAAPTRPSGFFPSQSYNGLALTPPMGWNDWYQYKCDVTQADVLANAQALVSSGLAKLGYDYVNLDDCWMATTRTADGQLQADPTTFPNGIPWLASQLHHMGLKLGLYESFGETTCQGRPGSYGHYQQDAETFASWGVDFLKFDYCGAPAGITSAELEADYHQMSQDLLATHHNIVFSEELPVAADEANPTDADYIPYVAYSSQIANMWRVAPDLSRNFDSTIFSHLADDLPLAKYAHPGAWNDLDMLLTGNTSYNWTVPEEETQMSIWAELASPMIDSSDLTSVTASTLQVLGNKAVIAVDQDPLGKQGQLVATDGTVDVVAKPLADGDVAVLLANTGTSSQQVSTTAATIGLRGYTKYSVRDLWANTTVQTSGTITETVPADSAMLLEVTPQLLPW